MSSQDYHPNKPLHSLPVHDHHILLQEAQSRGFNEHGATANISRRLLTISEALRLISSVSASGAEPMQLLSLVCETLATNSDFHGVWGRLFRSIWRANACKDGVVAAVTHTTIFDERLLQMPLCAPRAVERGAVTVSGAVHQLCDGCQMESICAGTTRLVLALTGERMDYGILSVGLSPTDFISQPEQESFLQLAQAISERYDRLYELQSARESHLRSSNLYHTVFENTGTVMWIVDDKGIVTTVNSQFERLTGYTREETEGIMFWEHLFHPEDLPEMRETRRRRLEARADAPCNYEARIVCKSGEIRHVLKTAALIPQSQMIVTSIMDISRRKEAEQEVARLSSFLSRIVDNANVLIMVTTPDMAISMWNKAAEQVTGFCRASIVGKRDIRSTFRLSESQWSFLSLAISRVQSGETIEDVVTCISAVDDQMHTIDWHITPLPAQDAAEFDCLWIGQDTTQERRALAARRDAESRAQQNQRLAAVGQMAAGVAHEINNPVTGIVGFAELLLGLKIDDESRNYVSLILQAGHRVATIVEQLLTFARWGPVATGLVDLNEVIRQSLMIRKTDIMAASITTVHNLDSALPPICGDAIQMQQVVLNIISNAITEISLAAAEGTIIVSSHTSHGCAILTFEDDGPGIPVDNLQRLFDPFFTTRDVGQGTGLGLSICHKIVTEHGGRITAANRECGGAKFTVELPLADASSCCH